jgi:hypothetical protein
LSGILVVEGIHSFSSRTNARVISRAGCRQPGQAIFLNGFALISFSVISHSTCLVRKLFNFTMAQPNTGLPNTIFSLTSLQHRTLRMKEFLRYYRIGVAETATRMQLLSHLTAVESYFSEAEIGIISKWFQGGGLLSDLKPTLRKAGAHTKALIGIPDFVLDVNVPNGAENRIVPLNVEQECKICLVTLPSDAFPRQQITASCRHPSFTCLECLKQSLDIQIQDQPWDHISCPECPATINYHRVKEFASSKSFKQ